MNRLYLAGVSALFVTTAAHAELVTNGGFENPVVTDPCCNLYAPATPLPGWAVTTGNVEITRGSFPSGSGNLAYQGLQYLDLVGVSSVGGISQDLTTVVGQAYTLSFAYSHNSFRGPSTNSASFSLAGLSGTVTHSTGSASNLDWTLYSGTFTATSTISTLSFLNTLGTRDGGIFLDAISVQEVSGVPEPAVWAMMVAGFGGVGLGLRRRRYVARLA